VSARSTAAAVGVAVALVLGAVALAGTGPPAERLRAADTRLCGFPLEVTVVRKRSSGTFGDAAVWKLGPTTVRLRNKATGRTAVLTARGETWVEKATGTTRFFGHNLWLAPVSSVPYLSTHGAGTLAAPQLTLRGGAPRATAVDPCALVGSRPSLTPAATKPPWRLPANALSRMAFAGLTPLVGKPTRHDHMHLDVIVNGKPVTIPAGIGQAEPVDRGPGPCPPPPEARAIGDCAPGHYFTAGVAASRLQTHTSSGILHLQTERPGDLTLGQFFDEWGVRLDGRCLGAYCTGGGKELRVYADGKRRRGDPRRVVLRDGREIAVVFGGPGAFRSVPKRYAKRMPAGCGGPGEPSCFPG
jgi:hypothetical protein